MCFHIQRTEDNIECPVITADSAVRVMMMDTRLLLFLLLSANEFSFFSPELAYVFLMYYFTIPFFFHVFLPNKWGKSKNGSQKRTFQGSDHGFREACW